MVRLKYYIALLLAPLPSTKSSHRRQGGRAACRCGERRRWGCAGDVLFGPSANPLLPRDFTMDDDVFEGVAKHGFSYS